jgi:transposase
MVAVMRRRDARSLDHATLEEMRRLAVKRVLEGERHAAVAATLQVNAGTVAKWMMTYRRAGEAGLAARKAPGPESKLSQRQQGLLRRIIIEKDPRQLQFPYALWTLPIVAELITRLFGVVLHETTVSRMLRRMGLTPQRPTRRAFQRDEEECRRWAKEQFPAIVRQMKRRQSVLLFGDETGVHEDGPIDRTWGLRGQRPVVSVTGQRRRVNVISAISPRGRLWFRCFKGNLNAQRFITFLKDLLRDVRGMVDLILDRHPAHVAAATRRFIEEHRSRLRVHFLPGYAPNMNPDEHVWAHLKSMFRKEPIISGERIDDAVEASMEQIQSDRSLVRRFFNHPEVAYVREALHW